MKYGEMDPKLVENGIDLDDEQLENIAGGAYEDGKGNKGDEYPPANGSGNTLNWAETGHTNIGKIGGEIV